MAVTTFDETLSKIVNQSSILENRDEHAVEIGVILPLLSCFEWDISDVWEVYPQHQLANGGKVDFDLQIDGKSRVLVEVKRWTHRLNSTDEGQLADYCRVSKPGLAALTNGHHWRFYLPPTARSKDTKLREFLEFDILTNTAVEVEQNFREFLARARMLEDQAVKAARKLYRDNQRWDKLLEAVKDAVDKVTTAELAALIAGKVQDSTGSRPSDEQVEKILSPLGVKVISELPEPRRKKPNPKPASFTFQTGKEKPVVKEVKVWKSVLVGVCELMSERHPDVFKRMPLELPKRFKDSGEVYTQQIGSTGIYVKYVASADVVKRFCPELVAKFGYPKDSLTIEERSVT